ncbi:cyclase family protein [Paenibacillus turpanensis]|uniref:cyclase family protein n=1 Tax=Paenibacillus turpanensis TaxID=2689078 RepID=UPI00140D92E7|nr:cyclase family protein [Paenibacillus turpanensis]
MLNGKRLYDISMPIHEGMQVWKDKADKRPEFRNMNNHDVGQSHETRMLLDAHCGTHLDAPLHMVKGGATIDAIPLTDLIGTARVLDVTDAEESIGAEHLERYDLQEGEWVLLKTRNSLNESNNFDLNFVFLNAEGARYAADRKIRGVGTDALGIERAQPEYPTHRTLMNNGVLILEGLRLAEVPEGTYTLVLAPLKLQGIEAAPARAFLLGEE